MTTRHRFILAALVALGLAASPAAAQRERTSNTAAPTIVKTWRQALTTTTGDVVRVDCKSETPWLTGEVPQSRAWAVTIKNEDASISVYVRFRETTGLPVTATTNVDVSGAHTDFLVAPGEQWSLPEMAALQVAVKQASGTPTVRIDYECSGTPGY